MAYEVVPYTEADLDGMIAVWNEVVEEGMAFPQMETLDHKTGVEFFGKQDFVGVAKVDGEVAGLYILHPNNVADAATTPTPAMPFPPACVERRSARVWCRTACTGQRSLATGC